MLHIENQVIHEVRGVVVLAQEDRFRLQTEDGCSMLMTVEAGTGAGIEELEKLAGSGNVIRVRYKGEPDAGAVAVEILPPD